MLFELSVYFSTVTTSSARLRQKSLKIRVFEWLYRPLFSTLTVHVQDFLDFHRIFGALYT
jgi:hypothetical protein